MLKGAEISWEHACRGFCYPFPATGRGMRVGAFAGEFGTVLTVSSTYERSPQLPTTLRPALQAEDTAVGWRSITGVLRVIVASWRSRPGEASIIFACHRWGPAPGLPDNRSDQDPGRWIPTTSRGRRWRRSIHPPTDTERHPICSCCGPDQQASPWEPARVSSAPAGGPDLAIGRS